MIKKAKANGKKIRNAIHYPAHMAALMDYLCCGNYTKGSRMNAPAKDVLQAYRYSKN